MRSQTFVGCLICMRSPRDDECKPCLVCFCLYLDLASCAGINTSNCEALGYVEIFLHSTFVTSFLPCLPPQHERKLPLNWEIPSVRSKYQAVG